MVSIAQALSISAVCVTTNLTILDVTRLGVWILDGDPGHTNLLKYALNESNYAHTLVILTLSMTTPWSWVDQLEHWIKMLDDHIAGLKIDPGECRRRSLLCSFVETLEELNVP